MANEKRARQRAARESGTTQEARRQAAQDVRVRKQRNKAFIRFAIILAAVVAAFILIALLFNSGTSDEEEVEDTAVYVTFVPSQYGTGECAPEDGAASPILEFDDAPQMCIEQDDPLQATFVTSEGDITVELDTFRTTGTANNFVNLARARYYDGLEIFRTDPLAAIVESGAQTNSEDDPGPGYTIPDEGFNFSYRAGQLAMSRTTEPDSAGSQFFFTVNEDAAALDGQGDFVVFGEVTSGLDVLEAVLSLHVADEASVTGGRPSRTVIIESVTIESAS